jgi:hypothetical protein
LIQEKQMKTLILQKLLFGVAIALASAFPSSASADFLVSDNFGNQVLRYGEDGSFISAFVAPGSGGLVGAVGMVVAPNGDLLVASQGTNQVLRYNGISGSFVGVFASNVNMNGPSHMAFRMNGNLLVSNFLGSSVSEFDASGAYLGEFTSGTPGSGLQGVASFAIAGNGDVYVGSFNTGDIFVYDSSGAYQSTFSTGHIGAAGLWFQGSNLWVSSLLTDTVTLLDSNGTAIGGFSTGEVSPGNGTFPGFITASPFSSDEILIALTGAGGVYRYATDGSTGGPVSPFLIGGGLMVPGEVLRVDAIPEPSTVFGLGLFALGAFIRRNRRN